MAKEKEMRRPRCVYVFQFDEVRPDHLSVYGYHRRQKNIEEIAKDGVVFKTVISGSSYTGAATPVLWTGMVGPHTGVRTPYDYITAPLLQEYIKKLG
jgi:arylsulfatase A-like enzyme